MTPSLELVDAGPQEPAPTATTPTAPPGSGDTSATGPASTSPAELAEERKRKRREREETKRRAAEKRRAAAAARKARKTAEPAQAAELADEDDGDEPGELVNRTDTDRARDAAAFLGVAYRVVGLLVGLFGAEWKTAPNAPREDAVALVPVMRRSPGFDRFVSYVAAPFVIVERVAASIHRKPKELAG